MYVGGATASAMFGADYKKTANPYKNKSVYSDTDAVTKKPLFSSNAALSDFSANGDILEVSALSLEKFEEASEPTVKVSAKTKVSIHDYTRVEIDDRNIVSDEKIMELLATIDVDDVIAILRAKAEQGLFSYTHMNALVNAYSDYKDKEEHVNDTKEQINEIETKRAQELEILQKLEDIVEAFDVDFEKLEDFLDELEDKLSDIEDKIQDEIATLEEKNENKIEKLETKISKRKIKYANRLTRRKTRLDNIIAKYNARVDKRWEKEQERRALAAEKIAAIADPEKQKAAQDAEDKKIAKFEAKEKRLENKHNRRVARFEKNTAKIERKQGANIEKMNKKLDSYTTNAKVKSLEKEFATTEEAIAAINTILNHLPELREQLENDVDNWQAIMDEREEFYEGRLEAAEENLDEHLNHESLGLYALARGIVRTVKGHYDAGRLD